MYKHPLSDVSSKNIGQGTRIWQFSVVLSGAVIGDRCNICSHTFIENDVILGDDVTIKNGVFLWDGLRIHDKVFVGPNVTFTNDNRPRSGERPKNFEATVIETGASIGANSTILPGLVIGARSLVGAGSVVTKNVPPGSTVFGSPAQEQKLESRKNDQIS